MRLGISSNAALLLLFSSLVGSYFNIPVAYLLKQEVLSQQVIDFFGMRYVVPFVAQWPGTLIAVNVGGAVIPTMTSVYLLVRNQLGYQLPSPRLRLRRCAMAFSPNSRSRHCRAIVRAGSHGGDRCLIAPAPAGGAARLYRRQPRHTHRRQSAQSRQHPRAGSADGLDRRSRNLDGIFLIGIVAVLIASLSQWSGAERGWAR